MRTAISFFKFFLRVEIIGRIRALLLACFSVKTNREGWEKRILIVYLQSIGDVVVFSSVLQHYQKAFPGHRITLLIKAGLGVEKLVNPWVDTIMGLQYRKFALNPFYGRSMINQLKGIGFHTVICQDHAPAEINGKIISLSIGAARTVAYEGFGIGLRNPFDGNIKRNVRYAVHALHPRFTLLVPSIDKDLPPGSCRSIVEHYMHFFNQITHERFEQYATHVHIDAEDAEIARHLLEEAEIHAGAYVVLNLGSNAAWRNWPVERFAEVSKHAFASRQIPIVLLGASGQEYLGDAFQRIYSGRVLNLIGRIGIVQTAAIIRTCLLVLTNDTSTVHFAVACKKPSICILGGGYANAMAYYGYHAINIWVRKPIHCFGDNFQCAAQLKKREIAPCIRAVGVAQVSESLMALLAYLDRNSIPQQEPFLPSYFSSINP